MPEETFINASQYDFLLGEIVESIISDHKTAVDPRYKNTMISDVVYACLL